MPAINPYLNFNGSTEEAFNFYRSVFGGEFSALMRFGGSGSCEQMEISESDAQKIMHVSLPIGTGSVLMATDTLESMGQRAVPGTDQHVAIQADSRHEADRLFNELSAGGKIEVPMSSMPWGGYFGCFADKYGVQWMVNFDETTAKA